MIIVLLVLLFTSCNNNNKGSDTTMKDTRYFESFRSYNDPPIPYNEISLEETKMYRSYYKVNYNKEGKIIEFTKYLDGKWENTREYLYNGKGILYLIKSKDSEGNQVEKEIK